MGTLKKIRVAITGGPGSGKTYICKLLESAGFPVFYADEEAKLLYTDPETIKRIETSLGLTLIDKPLNEIIKAISATVFSSKSALAKLEAIVHPKILERFKEWESKQCSPVVLMESAIIFEKRLEDMFDRIICVYTPKCLAQNRIGKDLWNKRVHFQLPPEMKAEKAHWTILNDNQRSLIDQLNVIISWLEHLASR